MKTGFRTGALKTLALVLAFLMAFSVFANVSGMFLTASAEDIVVWDGSNAAPAKGTGTEADPYQISNGAELNWVARLSEEDSAGKYFVIVKDIYLTPPANITYDENGYAGQFCIRCWPSGGVAGGSSYYIDALGVFAGNIDGQGYTIFGMQNAGAL